MHMVLPAAECIHPALKHNPPSSPDIETCSRDTEFLPTYPSPPVHDRVSQLLAVDSTVSLTDICHKIAQPDVETFRSWPSSHIWSVFFSALECPSPPATLHPQMRTSKCGPPFGLGSHSCVPVPMPRTNKWLLVDSADNMRGERGEGGLRLKAEGSWVGPWGLKSYKIDRCANRSLC